MITTEHHFIGALMTRMLVGRDKEQAAIRRATSAQVGDTFELIALVAKGGIGKTRLLREASWQLGGPLEADDPLFQLQVGSDRAWEHDGVLCLPLIDVADPNFHNQISFLRQVRHGFRKLLNPGEPAFDEMDAALAQYDRAREEGRSYNDIQGFRTKVAAAFEQDYARLTKQYRVVWVVDTIEQLFGVAPKIEHLLRKVNITEADIGQTTYSWLLSFIGRRPRNTTLLLAGRPTPSRWLQDVGKHLDGLDRRRFDVEPFTEQETRAYFRALGEQIDTREYAIIADYLKHLVAHSERPEVMHFVTEGNPILLALYIDMLTSIAEEPDEFHTPLARLRAMSKGAATELRRRVEAQLLDYIESGVGHPENAVLQYLFVTRRGLNARRLKQLLGADETECQNLLDHLQRLSIVKKRFSKVFLHDELYTMYARYLLTLAPARRAVELLEVEATYQGIIEYCTAQIAQATQIINTLQRRTLAQEPLSDAERATLRDRRQARRRYKAEQLHYQLYLDPQRGFNQDYYILAEQAFMGNDFELDAYIQSELEIFFFGTTADLSQQLTGTSDDDWALLRLAVAEERTSRWIRRLRQYNKPRRAQLFAQTLIAHYETVIAPDHTRALELRRQVTPDSPHSWFDAVVEAYRCFAAIWQGAQIQQAIQELEAIIPRLEAELRHGLPHPVIKTRLLNVVAQCYAENGYGYALLGSYRLAMDRYTKAQRILQHTGHEALYAEVQNNLSRVVGELGNLHKAEGFCQEGLIIRQQLGFDFAVGLSRNTLSLIRTRNNLPTQAIAPAREALHLFAQLNNPRGMMLANIQLAEAQRQAWALAPDERTVGMLEGAEQLLRETQGMFARGDVQEGVREVQTNLEIGCLYRDWAHFLCEHGDRHVCEAKFAQAEEYLAQARRLAEAREYEQYALDAAVNRAYLYYYCRSHAEVEQMVREALAVAPPAYVLNKGQPLDLKAAINLSIFQQLSKLFALRADLSDYHTQFETRLEYLMLDITYSQLFSSAQNWEHFFLSLGKQRLRTLISLSLLELSTVLELVDDIIRQYHLRSLVSEIGPLQVDKVLEELTPKVEFDYLN